MPNGKTSTEGCQNLSMPNGRTSTEGLYFYIYIYIYIDIDIGSLLTIQTKA